MLIAFVAAACLATVIAFYSLLVRNAPIEEEEASGIPAHPSAEIVELPLSDSDERRAA